MRKFRRPGIIILTILIITSSFFFLSNSTDDFKLVKNLEIYYSLFRELNLFYVDETDPEKLVNSSIDGMLKTLDPYTTFIPESEEENFMFMTTGQYGGIGSLIRRSGEYAIIAEPYEGFPAAQAGLKAGDTLVAIDGADMKNKDISFISETLKGLPNTNVVLTIRRLGVPESFNKSLERKKITIKNVPYYGLITDSIGYIRLKNFTNGAAEEVKEALTDLKSKYHINALVLDLRDNPGGLLIEAVDISGLFIKSDQLVVSTRGRVKQWDYEYKTRYAPIDTSMHLAILVSRGSASASEIVAGALQDLDRAVVIGQRTYGKGLVQTTRDLSYNTKLKVTTAKYYIPSGRCIQALDYSNRNEDGSVGTIPDSLITAFTTRNGRTVYDGGGILPDFVIDRKNYSQIAQALYSQSIIFDYATIFTSRNDSIAPVKDFHIGDKIYKDFTDYVSGRNFTYQTESEGILKNLINTAKTEKYYTLSEPEFKALEEKLAHDNAKDLENFREEIASLLKEEICCRYYYQKGREQAIIENLSEIKKAVEVLNHPDIYAHVLSGPSSGKNELSSIN